MNPVDFFEKMAPDHSVTYKALVSAGIKAEIGFYSVSMNNNGSVMKINTSVSTSSLLKGNAPEATFIISAKLVQKLLADCADQWLQGNAVLTYDPDALVKPKVKPEVTEASAETVQSIAKLVGEDLKTKVTGIDYSNEFGPSKPVIGPAPVPSMFDAGPKKVNLKDVVQLRTASVVGQMTRGTSPGSIYRAVAISQRLKVAARINGSEVSLRAEGVPNAFEKGKLKALGFSETASLTDNGYWSVHLDCTGIPSPRVIGAVLMDLGISFDQQAKNLKEAQLEN
jgi:hypothetical protein